MTQQLHTRSILINQTINTGGASSASVTTRTKQTRVTALFKGKRPVTFPRSKRFKYYNRNGRIEGTAHISDIVKESI